MNKVYKVVWNKARNCYVVASELAKSSSRGTKVVAAVLAVSVMSTLGGDTRAFAAPAVNPAGDGPGVAIGIGSSANNVQGTAVGHNAVAKGAGALAIGLGNVANVGNAIAVGANNIVNTVNSVAVGLNNNLTGNDDLVFGRSNTISAVSAAAFGRENTISNAFGYAMGYKNSIKANNAYALGESNSLSGTGSYVIGKNNKVGGVSAYTVGEGNISTALRATALGYGNRAGGQDAFVGGFNNAVGSTSKNSVVIGQNARVGTTGFKTAAVDPTTGAVTATYNGEVDATDSVVIGNSANVMSLNGVALGRTANVTATGKNGVALGSGASVQKEDGIALGSASVANRAAGSAGWDFATGKASTVTNATWVANKGAVSVGNGSGVTRQITSVAAGSSDTDAVNVAQLKNATNTYIHANGNTAATAVVNSNIGASSATAGAAGKRSVAVGIDAKVQVAADQGVALGASTNVQSVNGIAIGNGANTSAAGVAGVAVGQGASVSVDGGLALGAGSVANRAAGSAGWDFATGKASTVTNTTWVANKGAVSVGNGSGVTRQITGVAAGSSDTDAVNVAQVKGIAKQLTADGVSYFHVNATNAGVDAVANNRGVSSATAGAGGKNSTAAGINAMVQKDAEESTAVGFNANVTKKNAVAVGNRSSVQAEGGSALGYNAQIHADGQNGVAVGSGSYVRFAGGVAVGGGARSTGVKAVAVGSGAVSDGAGSIAVGDTARVASNGYSLTSIAVGKNAYVLNGTGQQEYELGFDKNNWTVSGGLFSSTYTPKDLSRIAGGISVGTNSYARTGSVQIGSHTYTGKMGGINVTDKTNAEANIVNMTTVGSNSFNKGAFSNIMGSYSIATGDFDASGGFNSLMYGGQNFGANVVGSLNSIRSKGMGSESGVANSIIGVANITEKSNGALIFGAGNEIKNSLGRISGSDLMSGAKDVDEMVNNTMKAIRNSEGGGATLAIGGGNKADYTQASQMIGVNNTLTGTSAAVSKYNMINGYKNTAGNVSNVSVIGSENIVENTKTAVLLGDKRKLTAANNSIILGSADQIMTTNKAKVVVLGANANSTVEGGVALGADSVADRISADLASRYIGYDPTKADHSSDTTGTWKSKLAAVSVGAAGKTRQITNVAAGKEDTDAVNVAQLKKLQAGLESSAVHYYSVNDAGRRTNNYNNDGAKGGMALAAGAGATANGTASTVTGSFSRVDGDGVNGFTGGFQGATASAYGAFNTIGAKSGVQFDGVANSIVGVANRTENANAALIFGAGNKVTNSYRDVSLFSALPVAAALKSAIAGNTESMVDALGGLVKDSGGAVLAIGGANTADYALLSKVVGVGNTLTGAAGAESKLNMIDGFGNTGKDINNTTIIGSQNTAEKTNGAVLLGNKRKLTAANNSVILGSADKTMTTDKAKVVVLGANANSTVEGGVALGADSVASTDKGVAGYDPATKAGSTDASATWKSTAAAVSVGDKAQGITRQITNVAAGTEDTDAVNVAQLKKLQETVNNTAGEAAKHSTVVAGDYVQVVEGTNAAGGKEYTISGPQLTSADGTVKITDKVENGKKVGYNLSVDTSAISGEISKGMNFAGDTGAAVNKKLGETLAIKGGATELTEGNIGVEAKDGALNVKLAKNVKGVETLEVKEKITVGETVIGKDSVTTKEIKAGDTTVNNDGMKINNGPSITKDNVDMNNQQIHNVKEGTASSDAATVGQVRNITDRLGGRVDKVGAGAAALAALHPVDFDADDKLDIAAGWGNYRGENALALGAFYRPDERTLFSIGGTFGNGENMVNAGFTFKLDRRAENGGIRPITSKAALVKKVETLTADNAAMKNKIDTMESEMKELKEIIAKMAGSANK